MDCTLTVICCQILGCCRPVSTRSLVLKGFARYYLSMQRECAQCGTITTNSRFCSNSCGAKSAYRNLPRQRLTRTCATCGCNIRSRRKYCDECLKQRTRNWGEVTYAAVTSLRSYQKNSRIRDLARKTYLRSGRPKSCYVCGYATHFEVCHLRAISSFPENVTVAEINDHSNLIALCPNHHWELDHNLLTLDFTDFDSLHS